MLRDRDLGRFAEPSRLSVAHYLEQWLQQAAKPKVRERTFCDYTEIVVRRIKPRLGAMALDKLTPLAIQTFYNELTDAGLSPQTVRNTHTVLQSALKQAVRWRMLQYNPAADVDLPRKIKTERPALDSTQALRFIEAAREVPRGIAYLVGLTAGMRPHYDLRPSCATLLLEAGKNPKIVAERLGHASIVLTMDTCSHVTPTMQQEAADTLDDLLFRPVQRV